MASNSGKLAAAVAIAVFVAFVTLVLLASYSTVPRSALGWIALFVIGLPTWLFLELLGDKVLSAKAFSRMSSGLRIALAVPAVLVVAAIGFALIWVGRYIIMSL